MKPNKIPAAQEMQKIDLSKVTLNDLRGTTRTQDNPNLSGEYKKERSDEFIAKLFGLMREYGVTTAVFTFDAAYEFN